MSSYSKLKSAIEMMQEGRAFEAGRAFSEAVNEDGIEDIYSFLSTREGLISTSRAETVAEENDEDNSVIRSIVQLSMKNGHLPGYFYFDEDDQEKGPLKMKETK